MHSPTLLICTHPAPGPLNRLSLVAQIPQRLIGHLFRLDDHLVALVQLLPSPFQSLRVVQQALLGLVPESNLVKVICVCVLELVHPLPLKVLLQSLQLCLVAVVSVP